MSSSNYYVIYKGIKTGIFHTWDECKLYIQGYPNAIYKKFNNLAHAEYFLKNGTMPSLNQSYVDDNEHISIFTDGSTIRKDNTIKYGYGVYIPSFKIEISNEVVSQIPNPSRVFITCSLMEALPLITKTYTPLFCFFTV